MSAKHTPGPWESGVAGGRRFVYAHKNPHFRVASICSSNNEHAVDVAPIAEGEANARIIAAAPDLADALERMLVHHGETCHNLNCPLGIHAASALKKAGRLP